MKHFNLFEFRILNRLRSGHCHLNEYLNRFDGTIDENCEECKETEDVPHFLFSCKRFENERCELKQTMSILNCEENELLFPTIHNGNMSDKIERKLYAISIRRRLNLLKAMIKYTKQTKRFVNDFSWI